MTELAGPKTRNMLARRWLRRLVPPLLLVGAVAHGFYWYWPRERPDLPRPGSGAAELLTAGAYDAALWLPYPHQNLGELEKSMPELAEVVAASSRLLGGRSEGEPPSFGPFRLPPSRELTVALDLEGGRAEAVAEVYPLLGFLARLAGKIAGNPWLAGGEVESGRRRFGVSWEGNLWRVKSLDGAPSARGASTDGADHPKADLALALLRVARPLSGLPAGTYALEHQGRGFLLSGLSGWRPPVELVLADSEAAAVAFVATPTGERLGALFDSRLSLVPRLATFHEPGKKRWKLPAESLLELAGDLPQGHAGGWNIVAVDDNAYQRAVALAPRVAALRGGPLTLGLWLRPAEARAITAELAKNLDKIPVLGDEPSRRFRDMTTLLAALERFERVTVVAGRGSGELRLEFDTPGLIP